MRMTLWTMALAGAAMAALTPAPARACHLDHLEGEAAAPARAVRVVVDNRTGRKAELVQGRLALATLGPGERVILVLDPRAGVVEARVDGRLVGRLDPRSSPARTWRLEAPDHARVEVRNPLPIPVVVDLPGMPSRVLRPGERLEVELPAGRVQLTFRRRTGEAIAVRTVAVDPFEGADLRVPPPAHGILVVVNPSDRPVRIVVDDGTSLVLQPGERRRIEVSPGRHAVRVHDVLHRPSPPRVVRTVYVDRYEESLLELAGPRAMVVRPHRPRG